MKQLILTISLLMLLTSCTTYTQDIRVKTEVGHNADLSYYKSYTWAVNITSLNDRGGKWQAPGIDIARETKFFIDRELHSLGLIYSNTNPEITVAFQLGADMQSLKLKKDPESGLAVLKNVPDAALLVILTDIATKNIIWISKAEAELQKNASAELVRKRIDYTITEMFKPLNKKTLF